jgi:CHAD domain-containing protein
LRVTISDVAKLAHFARHAVQLERHHPLRLDARHLRFVLLMTECLDVGV